MQELAVAGRDAVRGDQAGAEHRDAVEHLLRGALAQAREREPVRVPVDDVRVLEADHSESPSSACSRRPIRRANPGITNTATVAISTHAATMYGNRLYGWSGTGYTLW